MRVKKLTEGLEALPEDAEVEVRIYPNFEQIALVMKYKGTVQLIYIEEEKL